MLLEFPNKYVWDSGVSSLTEPLRMLRFAVQCFRSYYICFWVHLRGNSAAAEADEGVTWPSCTGGLGEAAKGKWGGGNLQGKWLSQVGM